MIKFVDKAIALGLLSCLSLPAFAETVNIDDVKPRAFNHADEESVATTGKNGVREMEIAYPSQTQAIVNILNRTLMAQHHKATFKQEGKKITIQDLTAKRTWIIRTRHIADRKIDTKGLEVVVTLFPGNCGIPFYVSRVFEKQNNFGKALDYYRKGCDILSRKRVQANQKQSDYDKSVEAANCAYYEGMMGRYESAVKDFTRAIEYRPDYKPNYFNRAQAYKRLHKLDLASADEKKAKEMSRSKPAADRGASREILTGAESALILVSGEAYEAGLDRANAALAKNPKDSLAQQVRGRALLKIGQYGEALAAFKKVQATPQTADELKSELEVAEKLAKSGPAPYGDISVLKGGSQLPYAVLEKGKRVMMTADKIAANHRGDYRVYESIARAQRKAGNIKALDDELSKLLAISPYNMRLIATKIESSQALRHWPEVEKYCDRYLDMVANDGSDDFDVEFFKYVYTIRALARRAQNNYTGAIADETTLLKIEPDVTETYVDRGDCYLKAGKFAQAVEDYSKAIQFDDTKSGVNYERRAMAYDRLNKGDLAKADRETAKRLSGAKVVRPD